ALVMADGTRSAVVVRRAGRLAGLRALAADAADPGALASEVRWTLRALGFSGPVSCAGPAAAGAQAALAAVLDEPVDVLVPPAALAGAGRADDVTACAVPVGLVLAEGRRSATGITLSGAGEDVPRRWRRVSVLAAAAVLLGLVDVALVRGALVRR